MNIYTVLVYTGVSPRIAHVIYHGAWGAYARALFHIVHSAYIYGANVARMFHLGTPVTGVDMYWESPRAGM